MPNIAAQAKQGSAEPEVPPEVAARRPIALTHIAAEDGGAQEQSGLTTVGQSGRAPVHAPRGTMTPNQARTAKARATKAKKAVAAAVQAIPAEPLAGLTRAQIDEIRGRTYPGAPKMDGELGDRTPAFVNWLYKNHPQDAAVRYYARDIWPTE